MFKGEVIYIVNGKGEQLLLQLKKDLFKNQCFFNGKNYNSFREVCENFIKEFDVLLTSIHQRFIKKQLLVRIVDCDREIPVKLWRLMTQWISLDVKKREQLNRFAFTICQEEIKKSKFNPLVFYPNKQVSDRVEKELLNLNKSVFLFKNRENEFLLRYEQPLNEFSPRVKEYCRQFEELEIEWINSK